MRRDGGLRAGGASAAGEEGEGGEGEEGEGGGFGDDHGVESKGVAHPADGTGGGDLTGVVDVAAFRADGEIGEIVADEQEGKNVVEDSVGEEKRVSASIAREIGHPDDIASGVDAVAVAV